ncbi:MAG: twin-arginine translocase subunit TatC [Candidatus Methanoperedens sp.]|nr:twin-arginine translocase subunit TatC [Candidatus Methanoperedens sp.]
MPLEDFSWMLSEIRRKLFYIVIIFGIVSIVSYPYMENIINKIEDDMLYSLVRPANSSTSRQLTDISNNLSLLSSELEKNNNSIIAQNLTNLSGELLNISQKINLRDTKVVALTPLEGVMLKFKMSLIFGFFFVLPLILYYAHRGLKGRLKNLLPVKKSLIISALITSLILFLIGAGYAYYILPYFMKYLNQENLNIGEINYSVSEFINFIVMTILIIGLSFELPLILTVLVRSGITSRSTLAHYRKHAYVILLIISAWITPDPTMLTQVMVMLPFAILYEVSLMLLWLTGR